MGMWYSASNPTTFIEGRDFNCSVQISPASFPNKSVIRSMVPNVTSPAGLYGYLHVDIGNYDGSPIVTPASPIQQKNITNFFTDIDWAYEGDGVSSFLHELYGSTTGHATGGLTDKVWEVGAFPMCNPHAQSFVNTAVTAGGMGNFTDPIGRVWKVGQATGTAGPYYVFALSTFGNVQGRVYWKEMLAFLRTAGKITGNEYIQGVACGIEPDTGFDKLTLNSYTMTLN